MSAMGRAAEQAMISIHTIEAFVDGSHTADVFEEAYLRLVKRTPGILERELSEIVNGLFGDVDAYVGEDGLRGEWRSGRRTIAHLCDWGAEKTSSVESRWIVSISR